jgi:hypothetical protein
MLLNSSRQLHNMITLKSLLCEEVKKISLQTAIDGKMFGPVYHGTSAENRDKIAMNGFKVPIGHERSGEVANGFEVSDYYGGIPAPIHMLGFGVYLTTSKTIAKQFSHGTLAGNKTYFIDAPHLETINFGSPRTMMKWWMENGYDYKISPETTFGGTRTEWGGTKNTLPAIREERLRATINMTNYLKKRYEAVWYKGKGMYRLLDGDQVCVFDPNNIYQMDKSLIKPGEVGSKVRASHDFDPYNRGEIVVPKGTPGIITHKERPNELQTWASGSNYIYRVKFDKGGHQYNILDKDIESYNRK